MPDRRQYLLVANRAFVWERMRKLGLSVTVLAVADSFLERAVVGAGLSCRVFRKKRELLGLLEQTDADVVVSNGCPYILPISQLSAARPDRLFVNIHPSFLPSMRGPHPIHGAVLLARGGGASCHVMDDGIDTGPIISRIKIPDMPEIEAGLLYQLSFRAEADAFELGWQRDFVPLSPSEKAEDPEDLPDLYFSCSEEDRRLVFTRGAEDVYRRIRAFSTRNRPAFFVIEGHHFTVRDVEWADSAFLRQTFAAAPADSVLLNYEGRLLVRVGERVLKLKQIEGPVDELPPGTLLA